MRLVEGQVAVITGAANGIGFALAESFAKRGLAIAIADVEASELADAEQRLAMHGTPVLPSVVDVTDRDQVFDLAAAVFARFGQVDIVCNNAGVMGRVAPAWEFDHRDWKWIIDVNLWGVIHGLEAFVPHLVSRGSGHVLNTASMAGLTTIPRNAIYNATKHAVVSLSETLAADFSAHAPGVGVTVLCPGPTNTRLATEGSRWLPAHLSATMVAAPPSKLGSDHTNIMEPSDLAEEAIRGIETGMLYVAPNVGSRARVDARIGPLLRDVTR